MLDCWIIYVLLLWIGKINEKFSFLCKSSLMSIVNEAKIQIDWYLVLMIIITFSMCSDLFPHNLLTVSSLEDSFIDTTPESLHSLENVNMFPSRHLLSNLSPGRLDRNFSDSPNSSNKFSSTPSGIKTIKKFSTLPYVHNHTDILLRWFAFHFSSHIVIFFRMGLDYVSVSDHYNQINRDCSGLDG